MKVVPQAFYKHPDIEKIMKQGLCCVIHKRVVIADRENQRYLAAHALTLVLEGSLQIESFEGDLQLVPKDHFVFLPKGLYMITDLIPKDGSFEALVFFFDESLASLFIRDLGMEEGETDSPMLTIECNQELKYFTQALLKLYKGKGRNEVTRPKLLELLHLLKSTEQGTAFVQKLKEAHKKDKKGIVAFMEEHFDKPLDIADYAYLTGRSISSFHRDFKTRYGISPKKWLIRHRLEKAASLLQNTEEPVKKIMREAGYENTSHFIKTFHAHFGISPKQFQLKHRRKIAI